MVMAPMGSRSALTDPRHLLATLAIALLLGGGGAGIVGVARAQDAAQQPLVVGFHIPLPNQGDQALYDVEAESTLGLFDVSAWRLAWMSDHSHLRRDGTLMLANRLRMADTYSNVTLGDLNFTELRGMIRSPIMEAGQAIQFADEMVFDEAQPGDQRHLRYGIDGFSLVPCYARNGLQGASWTFDGTAVGETSACYLPYHSGEIPITWRATATSSHDGVRWVVLEAVQDGYFHDATTRMWMQEGLPYPVRIEVEESYEPGREGAEGHRGSQVYVLRELRRGDTPIATTPRVDGVLPAVTLAPRSLAGPDASGVDHPFPLQAAVDALLADEANGTAVQAWMDAHPDAYVGQASHLLSPNDRGQVTHQWDFVLTDGQDNLGRRVEHTRGPLVVSVPTGDLPTLVVPVDQEPSIRIQGSTAPGRFPLPADVPAMMPTVASMRNAYAFLAQAEGVDLPFTGWSFDLSCWENDEPCRSPAITSGGHRAILVDWNDALAEDGEQQTSFDSLTLSWNGTQLAGSSTQSWGFADADASTAPAPLTEFRAVDQEGLWMPLSGAQAAGVGVAALLLALLYWLSPLAKSGALGLFSRIRDDDLLEHPNRALLLQVIQSSPGIHYQEPRRRAGMAKGVLQHHLEKLEAGGLVQCKRAAGYACYFPAGTDRRVLLGAGVLNSTASRRVFELVCQTPGISTPILTAEAGIAHATLHHHLARLTQAGLIGSAMLGRTRTFMPTATGVLVAQAHGLRQGGAVDAGSAAA
jgi:predicted transcriptional regulator